MTLQQCRYIVAIAEYQTINRAAKALFVTQPTISKAISELEAELDVIILRRNNKGITFTEAGKDILFYANMLLEQSAAMKAHLKARKVQPSLQFSITSQHYTFAVEALAALIEKLEASPKMTERYEINFREGKSTAVIEEVAEGISAIGIIALTEVNRLFLERAIKSKALTFHPLANIRQHVYLSASHPLSSESAISLESLKSYPRLTYKKDDLPQAFSEEGNHLKFAAKVIYLNDRATMDKLLMTTTGYNIGTGCLSRDSYRDWLRVIPLINGYDMTIGCITRKDIVFTDHLAYYFEALKAAVQQSLPETSNAADTLPKT